MKTFFNIQRFSSIISGTSGNDDLKVGGYWDNSYFTAIYGYSGDDTLVSDYSHYDTLYGGDGNDYLKSTGGYGATRVDMH